MRKLCELRSLLSLEPLGLCPLNRLEPNRDVEMVLFSGQSFIGHVESDVSANPVVYGQNVKGLKIVVLKDDVMAWRHLDHG